VSSRHNYSIKGVEVAVPGHEVEAVSIPTLPDIDDGAVRELQDLKSGVVQGIDDRVILSTQIPTEGETAVNLALTDRDVLEIEFF